MNLQVDKLYYNKFYATDVRANVLLSESGISVENAKVNHAGGSVDFKGKMAQGANKNVFSMNTNVTNVDIQKFFYSFNNFGLESMSSKNLKGFLSAKATLQERFQVMGN